MNYLTAVVPRVTSFFSSIQYSTTKIARKFAYLKKMDFCDYNMKIAFMVETKNDIKSLIYVATF